MATDATCTGARALALALKQQGVEVVFGIVGIPVVEVAEAIQAEGIRFISFRNEQSCSYAASAYGYLTQKPGVCLVVSGPGVVHALAGVVNSQVNTWPLVLIGGACETQLEGAGAFQEALQVEMCRPYAKYAARPPSIAMIPSTVERAFTHAASGRPGAAYIDLPADYIQGAVALADVAQAVRFRQTWAQANPADVAEAARILAAAHSPLIIVGKGAAYSRAEAQVRAFVDKFQAPFLPTPMAKGVVPDSHPLNVSSARSDALKGADVIVLLGARVNWILHFGRRFSANARIIQVDVCPEEIGVNVPVAVALQGHLPLVVQQLTDAITAPYIAESSPFVPALLDKSRANAAKQNAKYGSDALPMTYHRAFYEIKLRLPADVVLVSEGANTMDIARTVYDFQEPRRRLDCATYANMGVGMGFAIAAQLHYPESRVVAIVGDSAFGFSAMELETAVRARLPLVVIVINNNGIYFGLDQTEYDELEKQGRLPATALTPDVRYELIAEAVGARGRLVKTPEDLGDAVNEALSHDGLTLINCLIAPGGYQKLQFAWMADSAQYALDKLHYAMFQLLFFILIPTIIAISESSAFNSAVEITRFSGPTDALRQQTNPLVEAQTLKPAQTQSDDENSGAAQHKYIERCVDMEKTFMQMVSQHSSNNAHNDSLWTPLVSMTDPYPITIHGHTTKPFCFRVAFYAPTTPATAFDLLADITRRHEWDELTDSTRVVEKLGHGDALHYVKMKPIWPTSARDSVLLARITKIAINNTADGEDGYLNVSQSVEDSRIPEDPAGRIVRMEAGIAGQLITDAPQEDRARLGLVGDNWCKVVQIADGDLKGWIPTSVLKFVATQALPRSLNKVCNQLAAIPTAAESQLLAQIAPKSANDGVPVHELAPTADDVDRRQDTKVAAAALVRHTTGPAGSSQRLLRGWSSSGWFKVIMRYATPAVIAAITSIIISIFFGERRWRRSIIRR
ncbi:hypothetical protein LPJ81_002395 [Coemansia sp. IMI 209127]|nr:hypothetical protein LPJ81_002395 [Coemansia sp. IMI 209127]